MVRYEILGSLRIVKDDGHYLAFSAPKMGTVLATLLIRADQVVPIEQLVQEVWGGEPPRRATAALYVYVSQLRKLLAGRAPAQDPIITRAPGYMLRTKGEEVDLQVFQRLAVEGRSNMRTGRYEQARQAFEQALKLWRGPALSEMRQGPVLNGFAIWLEEIRLECREMLVEANLQLGRHREQIGVLHELIREHPLHEAFYRQLMLALHHSERRADALGVYQDARATLNRELGLDPGRRLREVQQSILLSDDEFDIRPAV